VADYYARALSADRLRHCYAVAQPRVRQYLEAEIAFLAGQLAPGDRVLELGCGYGRVAVPLARTGAQVVGIDTALASLRLGRSGLPPGVPCRYVAMDAARLGFRDGVFDAVVCVQNGISAFHQDPARLLDEALRVTRPGGRVWFSTYTGAFWPERLEWFRRQAAEGLVGPIDEAATRPGVIVCRDGFTATTFTEEDFRVLCTARGIAPEFTVVDGSSLFCTLVR
jgi:SAM-dependent methyltransferase